MRWFGSGFWVLAIAFCFIRETIKLIRRSKTDQEAIIRRP